MNDTQLTEAVYTRLELGVYEINFVSSPIIVLFSDSIFENWGNCSL